MLNNIVAFDVETTGLDIYHDQIIEFGAWRIEDGVPVKSLEFLVRPSKEVPKTILQLTGISEDMLLKAKPLEDYRADILTFFEGATLIGHNISFDLAILERTLGVRLLNKRLDTLELSRIIFPTFSRHKLSALVEQLEVEVPVRFHKAKSDAYIAWQVFAACWQKIQAYDLGFFQNIDALAEGWEGLSFFHHAKKEIARTFPDRPIKTEYALNNVLDNFFLDEIGTKSISETEEWVISSFKPGGILEEVIKGYESRTGQLHMAKTVLESLTNNQHAIIEAGTGTGKSFAYLIPGIWWAKKNARKLIVATHTIPLQEQIQNKDLPLLQRVLPFSFRSILLKGKGNYCCLKKFMFVLTNFQELGLEERLALISILVWLRETTRGDLQELGQIPYLKRIWPKISAESEICKPSRCSFSGRCFLNKARKQAEQADLIIVNHSLLFSDIKTDYNVLPEYHGLIIDEAHHLHQTAIEQLGIEVSLERIEYVLDQIYRPVGTSFFGNINGKTGRLLTIVSENTLQKLVRVTDEIPAVCTLIREQAVELFSLFAQVAGENKTYRLTSRHTDYPWWNTLYIQLENLKNRLTVLWTTVQHLIDMFNTEEDMEIDSFLSELLSFDRELSSMLEGVALVMDIKNNNRVTWLERSGTISVKTSPVDVKEVLQEKIFSRLDSTILTSATMTVASSFNHFLQQVGLPATTRSIQVESPFDYDSQMQFFVVKDLPIQAEESCVQQIAEFIAEVTTIMGGRTLVLFTSNKLLNEIYQELNSKINDFQVLGQGIDGNRSVVLEQFLRNSNSVLLGANSFWEGIDIQGQALSCVILVKLPFWPPSMPLIEARSELLELQGINSFREFLLPEAVIRFKQGFGRLIRSRVDKGVVILLDSRVIIKSYGKVFLSSVPVRTHIRGDRSQVLRNLNSWIENEYKQKELS